MFIKLVVSAVLFFGVYVVMLYIMKEEVVSENLNKIFCKIGKKTDQC